MSAPTFRLTKAKRFLLIGLLVLFFIFGGPLFGPVFNAGSDTVSDFFYLHSCPPDEMRLRGYGDNSNASFTLNLKTGETTITVQPYWFRTDWGLFWIPDRVHSIFHTILALPIPYWKDNTPYSASELAEIQSALKALPNATGRGTQTGEFIIYLSCWNDGDLRIYSYHNQESAGLQGLIGLLEQNHPMLRTN
jgi:hypothetical protein